MVVETGRVMHDGTLACSAMLDLCKAVLAFGSAEPQNALVRIATNSLDRCCNEHATGGTVDLLQLCGLFMLSLCHLSQCRSASHTFSL
jgi:hypothetical protein